jgi:hypothetical protein
MTSHHIDGRSTASPPLHPAVTDRKSIEPRQLDAIAVSLLKGIRDNEISQHNPLRGLAVSASVIDVHPIGLRPAEGEMVEFHP